MNKLEELKELEKAYTKSKQPFKSKFKEFDLSFKDFENYNDLISKQKVIDEKRFFDRIQSGKHQSQNNNNINSDSDSEEESLFAQKNNGAEETEGSESLLGEFLSDTVNEGFYQTSSQECNQAYQNNLKYQRIVYGLIIVSTVVSSLFSSLNIFQSIFNIFPAINYEERFSVLTNACGKSLIFTVQVWVAIKIAKKLKNLVLKRIRYAGADFRSERKLTLVLIVLQLFQELFLFSINLDSQHTFNFFSFSYWASILIEIGSTFLFQAIQKMQENLVSSILGNKDIESKDIL